MHVIHLTKPVNTASSIGTMLPGDYLVQDKNAFEIALMAEDGTAHIRDALIPQNPNPTSHLIMRSGAIGDLLLMTPAISAYRIAHPSFTIDLCCCPELMGIFENTGLFDRLITYPLDLSLGYDYDRIISLENVMEKAGDTHATDAFAAALDVGVLDYKPIYHVTDHEKKKAASILSGHRPKVGLQLRTSSKNRDYPAYLWVQVMHALEEKGWDVYLFGLPGQIPLLPPEFCRPNIHDLSQKERTLRETVALIDGLDAFCGIDSSLLHFCHALKKPAVGLFGPFKWQTRIMNAPFITALTGSGDCAGCGWHVKIGQHFPDKPCRKTQLCSVLADIKPERIVAKIDALKPA